MLNTYTNNNTGLINHTHFEKQTFSEDCWDELTLAQQFSASNIGQFGYMLSFIRTTKLGRFAVVQCGEKYATISATGVIDIS
ncbi:MAG: hypothetical protein RPR91_01120 [Colwellia sp.]|jgi:hypothetical protein